jgi:hypothetical protein
VAQPTKAVDRNPIPQVTLSREVPTPTAPNFRLNPNAAPRQNQKKSSEVTTGETPQKPFNTPINQRSDAPALNFSRRQESRSDAKTRHTFDGVRPPTFPTLPRETGAETRVKPIERSLPPDLTDYWPSFSTTHTEDAIQETPYFNIDRLNRLDREQQGLD